MNADCHIHMVLDGVDWKASIARGIRENYIAGVLSDYQKKGYKYLRDGGDRLEHLFLAYFHIENWFFSVKQRSKPLPGTPSRRGAANLWKPQIKI